MGDSLSADDLGRVVRVYRGALAAYRPALNRLNVYPVPDGDTGTNMALTIEAVEREMDEAVAEGPGLDLKGLAQCLSHGSLMGARGNSGVILSQVLRGVAGAINEAAAASPGSADLAAADLVDALTRASDSAYAAVSNPVEGTILTVARAAARGAEGALRAERRRGASLPHVLEAARDAAAAALAGTTKQLPALRAAGVVDAGGAGLLLLLDSFLQVVDGRPVEPPPAPSGIEPASRDRLTGLTGTAGPGISDGGTDGAGQLLPADGPSAEGLSAKGPRPRAQYRSPSAKDVGDFRYEVMFFLEAPDEAVPVSARCGEATAAR